MRSIFFILITSVAVVGVAAGSLWLAPSTAAETNPYGGHIRTKDLCTCSTMMQGQPVFILDVARPDGSLPSYLVYKPIEVRLNMGEFKHYQVMPGRHILGDYIHTEPCMQFDGMSCISDPRAPRAIPNIYRVGSSGTYSDPITLPDDPPDPITEPPDEDELQVTLTADPTNIDEGESSTLEWSSGEAVNCEGEGDGFDTQGETSGSTEVSPSETTTYQVTCNDQEDNTGSDTAQVTVGEEGCHQWPSLREAGVNAAHWSGIDGPGRTDRARQEVIDKVKKVKADMPFATHITSACTEPGAGSRDPDGGSQHFVGKAVDIQPIDNRTSARLQQIKDACLRHGFNFSYTGSSFTHCDIGPRR